jgi:2'-5' RNA ligase
MDRETQLGYSPGHDERHRRRLGGAPALGFRSGLPAETVPGAHDPAATHWPGHSVIVIAVPPLEHLVRRRTQAYDDAYLSTDATFAHAHVTLLGPFVDAARLTPSMVSTVGQVLSRHPPFTARFTIVARFPDGMIHLLPDEEEPFRQLTANLADAFPDHPPYGGRYDDPRPHVTLDRVGPGVNLDTVRGWVAELVPVCVEVRTVQLSWYEQHGCRTLATWALR